MKAYYRQMIIFFLYLGEYVAQFKFTVLLMPNGPMKITGLPFEASTFKSEHSITDVEIQVNGYLESGQLIYPARAIDNL